MPIFEIAETRFNNKNFKTFYETVNVGELSKLDSSVKKVNREVLVAAGLVDRTRTRSRFWGGRIEPPWKSRLTSSASAKEKIEKAGGKAIDGGSGRRIERINSR